jgi:hypothetical protein
MGMKVSWVMRERYELVGEGIFEFEACDELFVHAGKKIININTF